MRCCTYLPQYDNLHKYASQIYSSYCCYALVWISNPKKIYSAFTKMNGAVSKVNKKFISHLTRAKRTPSAEATVLVSHALPALRFACLLRGRGVSFQRWRRSRKRLSVCSVLRCPDLWLQCTKLTPHCNHRSGHLKTEHTESVFLLRRHLRNWPRSKHEKWTAGSPWETWTVAAADGVRCAGVRWEMHFLLTFETAQFFCVYPVHRASIAECSFETNCSFKRRTSSVSVESCVKLQL